MTVEQRAYLAALADAAERGRPTGGAAWQALIFSIAAAVELPNTQAFEALYLAFLGRPNGPRAGWLLASLAPDSVRTRLREAAAMPGTIES